MYIELLGLLLKQLKTAAAAFSINKQLLEDTLLDDQAGIYILLKIIPINLKKYVIFLLNGLYT